MTHRTSRSEIFSKDFNWKNNTFVFDQQELKQQMQLSDGDNMAPSSPMKIFGSYVPKILAEETDFVAREEKDVLSVPKFTSTSHGAASSSFESSRHLQRKPWVIGDKHVPMTLGVVNIPDIDYDNITEPRHRQLNKYPLRHNEMDDIHKYYKSPSVSPGRVTPNFNKFDTIIEDYETEGDSFTSTEGSVSNAHVADNSILSTFRTSYSQHQQNMNTEEVLIPAPDYDEEEQVVYRDFEEINSGQQIGQPGQMTTKHPVKIYEGADLSMYLNDDDVDEEEVATGQQSKASKTLAKTVKSESGKSTDKYSFFKQQPKTKSQGKRKGKETAMVFNTVRNFSYADSKSVTLGKASVDHLAVDLNKANDDGERFLHANEQQSSYELFLRSRRGDGSEEQQASRDGSAGVGVGGSDSSPHNKAHTMWKKLTLRFKHT